jgi:hypothetical protein
MLHALQALLDLVTAGYTMKDGIVVPRTPVLLVLDKQAHKLYKAMDALCRGKSNNHAKNPVAGRECHGL